MTAADVVDARKVTYPPDDALELLRGISTLVVVRGKQVVTFDLKRDRPSDDVLLEHIIGRAGRLRAPTARLGRTLVVGFNATAYDQLLAR